MERKFFFLYQKVQCQYHLFSPLHFKCMPFRSFVRSMVAAIVEKHLHVCNTCNVSKHDILKIQNGSMQKFEIKIGSIHVQFFGCKNFFSTW